MGLFNREAAVLALLGVTLANAPSAAAQESRAIAIARDQEPKERTAHSYTPRGPRSSWSRSKKGSGC